MAKKWNASNCDFESKSFEEIRKEPFQDKC
jgi:hypothetical protein